MDAEYKTIAVKKKVYNKLVALSRNKKDTFSNLINDIINEVAAHNKLAAEKLRGMKK